LACCCRALVAAGFARSQAAYEAAYDALFGALDELEARLSRQRYLVGRQITEADWRLFPTLVRFDVVHFSLFKCNKQRVADYPNLSNYMRESYSVPGIAATVKPRQCVAGYWSIRRPNPRALYRKVSQSIIRRETIAPALQRNGTGFPTAQVSAMFQ
jgi:putative glutathione S-transferase